MSKTPKNVNILTHIYVLCDQENNIRYVGKTVVSLKKRLQQHISEAKRHPNKNHRINWINSVLNSGYYVNIQEIDSCPWCKKPRFQSDIILNFIRIRELIQLIQLMVAKGNLGFIVCKGVKATVAGYKWKYEK